MAGMTGCVGGDKYGFDTVVFDQFFQRRIFLWTFNMWRQRVTTLWDNIAYSDDLHIGMVLKAKICGELGESISHEANFYLTLGRCLPKITENIDVFGVGICKA